MGGGDKAAKGTQAGQQVYQEAIDSGASPQQATVAAARAIAESTGGAVNVTDEVAAQLTAKNSFEYDQNETFQLSNGSDTAIVNFGRPEDINYTLSGISEFLSGSPVADLSFNFAVNSIAGKFNRDATFAEAANRSYNNAAYLARDRTASIANHARNMRISAANNQMVYDRDKAFGTFGDLAYGTAEGFVDSIYQGVQFLGTAAASITPLGQAVSYLSGNGALNPFTTEYHSLLSEPTTVMQGAGRTHGEILSFAVGGEGLLLAGAKVGKGLFGASRGVTSSPVSSQVLQARQRQLSMLDDNVGFNISPTAWDNYPTIGRDGTFISDRQGITDIIGDFSGVSQLTLDRSRVVQLEKAFGLERGALQEGFKIRQVDNIVNQMTRSPMEGNQYFLGAGNHLPGGAPEMVINSISTVDTNNVKTLLEVLIK